MAGPARFAAAWTRATASPMMCRNSSLLGPPDATAPVRAIPGEGTEVPVWILGSSLYGAQLAADFGLPYAFASHFAPAALDQALEVYRRNFQPSQWLDRPRFMLAVGVFAAATDEEGIRLRTSMQLAFARLRTGRPGKLPAPVDDIEGTRDRHARGRERGAPRLRHRLPRHQPPPAGPS